jgi:hypothetical protein
MAEATITMAESKVLTPWTQDDIELLKKLHGDGSDLIVMSEVLCRYPKGIIGKLTALKIIDNPATIKGYDAWVASGMKIPDKSVAAYKVRSDKLKQQKAEKKAAEIKLATIPCDAELALESAADLSVRYVALRDKKKLLDADFERVGKCLAARIQQDMQV